MTKDEMKSRISMALKDPILQQGFEIICKNLSELEKENAELKETCNKWFEHLKNREEELLNELNNQNAKYESQIEELEKENSRLKDFIEHKENVIADINKLEKANKANEWHYPSKGEHPKEYKDILICFLTEDDMKDCVRGWYEYDFDEAEHYFKTVNTFGTAVIKNVIAWKEIVLPELKESKSI